MNDGMNAFFINTHTKGVGTDHHIQLIVFKFFKHASFFIIAELGMISGRSEVLFGKVIGILVAAFAATQINQRDAFFWMLRILAFVPCFAIAYDAKNRRFPCVFGCFDKMSADVLSPDFKLTKRRTILHQALACG